ncbi:MAG: hypothetical protein K2M36_05655, partial [Clostridia bacterium]|nr:hypothetical protein [Clostridia bacterium]
DKTVIKHTVSNDTSGNTPNTGNETNTPSGVKFNLDYLWWMVPTIVIGLVIIVVVVVFFVRKLKKPTKKAVKKMSAPVNTETLDKKRNRYDEGKE